VKEVKNFIEKIGVNLNNTFSTRSPHKVGLLGIVFFLAFCAPGVWAQGGSNLQSPLRWSAEYTQIYFDNVEGPDSTVGPGLQLQNGSSVVTDPALVIAGKTSVRVRNYGAVATNPAVVPLSGNTTYIVEFKYHILSYGSSPIVLPVYLIPANDNNQQDLITVSNLIPNAAASGTFSAGAQTAGAAQYYFLISASADSDVVIDNIAVFRQDPIPQTAAPQNWSLLENLPFPRLAKYLQGATSWQNRPGMTPGEYSVDQIESRLAFADVIGGLELDVQTSADPGSIRRLRQLNPNAVILPYKISEEQEQNVQPPLFSQVSLQNLFFQNIPNDWYVRDTSGNYVVEDQFSFLRFMNLSPFCPVVSGNTFLSFLLQWLNGKVFPSGLWDGIFFDNFFAETNIHIPNLSNPPLFNFDWNRNAIRDETPASTSDMSRNAITGMLQQFRAVNGDLQLVVGNSRPDPGITPYVNGVLFECPNYFWRGSQSQGSPAGWRVMFDGYLAMQAMSRHPRINMLEGCGGQAVTDSYLTPTSDDLKAHRFTMGTALMSDGFYGFDLHGAATVPLWYDEYSVDAQGNAIEDRSKKGYLGAALTEGVELTDGGSPVLQENFAGPGLPPSFLASPPTAVSVSNGALIISNSDHTQNGISGVQLNPALQLNPGTYLLTFDWSVVQTLDQPLHFSITTSQGLDGSNVPAGTVSGDSGTVHFPFVIPASGTWSLGINILGGGKVAISNVRLVSGGVGSWRRDFENGIVLVNPLPVSQTFSAADLAGTLQRTGIHQIKGTQAPDINNGQPVTDSLTLAPFDAIILLTDSIRAPGKQNFQIANLSGTSSSSSGAGSSIQVGYADVLPGAGSSTPAGMAIFDLRENGVLVSEATVPATSLIQAGRTYAEIGGSVDTGIAIANPNDWPATITFYYTDSNGANILSGTTTVAAGSQISAFLDQAPFITTPAVPDLSAVRTFTFSSSQPVGVIALRGYTNQRGEFLMTTLPVSTLDSKPAAAFAFPHYADGGGWMSKVVLVNPTDSGISGTIQFYSKGTSTAAGAPVVIATVGNSASSFNYAIPPRSAFTLQTADIGLAVQTGWISVTPGSGTSAPFGLVIFSLQSNGIRVSEAPVPAQPGSSAFRLYAEAAGDISTQQAGTIATGIAVSNPSSSNVTISFGLTNLDGTPAGSGGTMTVPAAGQIDMFLNQIPGFSSIPPSFKGILRISGANVFVTGLRGRYNERGDFLMTTTTPVDENAPPSSSELVFPQVPDGGGFTTQIILFSGTAGQSTSGALQFETQSGQPWGLVVH
jgi:hypothetical protein